MVSIFKKINTNMAISNLQQIGGGGNVSLTVKNDKQIGRASFRELEVADILL